MGRRAGSIRLSDAVRRGSHRLERRPVHEARPGWRQAPRGAVSAGVSVGAAVLLLANPIIGAAVGAGSLLAQKVLQDPIEQMFALEYVVSGGWSDPVVERSGRQPASVGPAAEANGKER